MVKVSNYRGSGPSINYIHNFFWIFDLPFFALAGDSILIFGFVISNKELHGVLFVHICR